MISEAWGTLAAIVWGRSPTIGTNLYTWPAWHWPRVLIVRRDQDRGVTNRERLGVQGKRNLWRCGQENKTLQGTNNAVPFELGSFYIRFRSNKNWPRKDCVTLCLSSRKRALICAWRLHYFPYIIPQISKNEFNLPTTHPQNWHFPCTADA